MNKYMNKILFRFGFLLAALVVLIVVGTVGFMILEGLTFFEALYFTFVTISTVGYGDIHPVTLAGRIFVVILIVIGIGTFLGVVANATQIILQSRQERVRKDQLNLIIGVFFSEIGTGFLHIISTFDANIDRLRGECCINTDWSGQDFIKLKKILEHHAYNIDIKQNNLKEIHDFLQGKNNLLIQLLDNNNLQEHESITDLLLAIFHLKDELVLRPTLSGLPDTDLFHLTNDIKRVYALLTKEWIKYMQYLNKTYPYLFSLALRTNPFSKEISPIVS